MDGLARLNAEHHVLRVRIILAEIVAVIGRNQRDLEFFLQLQQVALNARFFRQSLVLNFEIEIAFAENIAERYGGFTSCVVLPFSEILGNFTLKTRGQTDQPSGVLSQEFLAYARLVVEAMQRRLRDNLDQIAIAFIVLRQHDKMVVAIAFLIGTVVLFLADVEFATQDGLHARFLRSVYERHSAEDVAVVGHGHAGHVEFFDALDQALDVTSAVEHRVISVEMKMYELRLGHSEFKPWLCSSILCVAGTACMHRQAVENRGRNALHFPLVH